MLFDGIAAFLKHLYHVNIQLNVFSLWEKTQYVHNLFQKIVKTRSIIWAGRHLMIKFLNFHTLDQIFDPIKGFYAVLL